MWDFSTEPEFQQKLDWMKKFVKEEIEPIDLVFNRPGHCYDVTDKRATAAIKPLQAEVKKQKLWACHLGPDLGGQGYGQLKLGLMNEILGGSAWASRVFGTQAPDTGNAEILAMFGTPEQKERYLKPLLEGDIVSCFSMTEPQGGADPKVFECRAVRDGKDWVLNGYKWFSSQARWASFFIVMAVTDPDAPAHHRFSMFLVPAETPGVNIVRNVGLMGESADEGAHGYMHYENVRLTDDAILGGPGRAFAVAQARLGGGRIHHAMRTVGTCRRAFDMMCERALSRTTQGSRLADKQSVLTMIADSDIELRQFRLLVLEAAWIIDQGDHDAATTAIARVKVATPKVYHDVVQRAIQIHGSLGVSNEMPFQGMWVMAAVMGLVDGPTEVHQISLGKRILRNYKPAAGLFPTAHLPTRREAAMKKLSDFLERNISTAA
jgi:acyl-CoA dehydrogenase